MGRILTIGDVKPLSDNIPEDSDWNTFIKLILVPNPKFTDGRRLAVEKDFAMMNGQTEVVIRKAMLYYFKKRLNLQDIGEEVNDNQQIVLFDITTVQLLA